MSDEIDPGTAPLDAEHTAKLLEHFRATLAKNFGVTLVTDHNGAWGRAGTTHLTLRSMVSGDNVTANFVLESVTSHIADENQRRFYNETK